MRLIVLLSLLEAWPWAADRHMLLDLSTATGKDPGEIEGILESFAGQGILEMQEGRISTFDRERARNSLQSLIDPRFRSTQEGTLLEGR